MGREGLGCGIGVPRCGNGVEYADQKLGQPGGRLSSSLRSDGTDA
jgi:hypothetical protein